ncbi:MAG: hypothetical protein U0S50_15005 [Sphingopyxis sp.]|uniref:hypothetical protein n=1 Tax=Sphingopyxis sp. TaxID=1908224 RepID=UPI002ABC31C6|nr:hypothetical protein [Sphingopyxis sp.]MDZ3833106.1 hypothetical protein [Sphingopyxis sp.]
MTIARVRESPVARRIAIEVLNDRLAKDFAAHPVVGTMAVLPLYAIPDIHMKTGEYHHSWRWGWRYFWIHPHMEEGAIVDIRRTAGGRTRPQRYAKSCWGLRVTNVMANAAIRYAGPDALYRPRILRLPDIHMEAFWLSPSRREGHHHFTSLTDDVPEDRFVTEARSRLFASGSGLRE